MDAKIQSADAMHAAGLILKNGNAIATTWRTLLAQDPGCSDLDPEAIDNPAFPDLCYESVIAFSNCLRGDEERLDSLGQLWNSIQPTNTIIGNAIVAMSLFPEALRVYCDEETVPKETAAVIIPAARAFMREIITDILETADMRPGDVRWQKIAEDLERQRQRRLARTAVLTDISRAVNTTDNLEELFLTVRNICSRMIKTDYFTVLGYDGKTGQVTPHIVFYQGVRRRDLEGTSRYAGLARVVAETQEPVAVVDYAAACAARGIEPDPLGAISKQVAFLGAPMIQ